MAEITFGDWEKLELVIGKVVSAERVPKTDKLYRLMVDIGREEPIQIVSSLVDYYTEEALEGKEIVVLANLKPAKFGGEMSYGMLLCAEKGGKVILLSPERGIGAGARVT